MRSLLLAACLLGWATAEPLLRQQSEYTLRQREDGSCTLWSPTEEPLWSQTYPVQWSDALISEDGQRVVGIHGTRLTLVGSKGEVLAEAKMPQPVTLGSAWLVGADAYFLCGNWEVYQLAAKTGRLQPLSKPQLVPLLSAPETPGQEALALATIHRIQLSPKKLASLQDYPNELHLYQSRLKNGHLPPGATVTPRELAALWPEAKIQPLLLAHEPDIELLACLSSAAQLAEARKLAERPGAGQAAANRLLCLRGDRRAQEWVLQHCLKVTEERSRANDIAALTGAGSPLCPQLAPLLQDPLDYFAPAREQLLDYFLDNPSPEVLPQLAKFVGTSDYGSACQKVLREGTRVDLGADPQAWAKWFAQRRSSEPHQRAQALGQEPSAALWLGRSGTLEEVGKSLAQAPRTVAVLAAGSTERLGFTPQGLLARLQGNTTQRAYAWDVQGGVRAEFGSEVPAGLEFQFTPDLSLCLLYNPQKKELAVLGKVPLQWKALEQGIDQQVLLSPRGDCLVLSCPGYSVDTRLIPIQKGQILLEKSIALPSDRQPFFRPAGPSDVIGEDLLLRAPWDRPAVPLEGVLGYSPDGQKYLMYQEGYGLLDIASKRFQPIAPLREVDTTIKVHRFSPSAAYLALYTIDDVQVADTTHDRVHIVKDFSIHQAAFSSDERFLALAGENSLRLYRLPEMKQVAEFRSPVAWGDLAFSPDSQYLAANAGDRLQLWQLHPVLEIPTKADPTLLSELWTGQRLAGGAALPLTPAQFHERLKSWTTQTDQLWDEGKVAKQPLWRPFAVVLLLAAGTLVWKKRR